MRPGYKNCPLGVGIAIDDFGIDSPAFAYLPASSTWSNWGKFTECLDGDIQARLGQPDHLGNDRPGDKLGITVTAKLVETPAVARLRAFGCKAAQGWHFAKALPVDFFRE